MSHSKYIVFDVGVIPVMIHFIYKQKKTSINGICPHSWHRYTFAFNTEYTTLLGR